MFSRSLIWGCSTVRACLSAWAWPRHLSRGLPRVLSWDGQRWYRSCWRDGRGAPSRIFAKREAIRVCLFWKLKARDLPQPRLLRCFKRKWKKRLRCCVTWYKILATARDLRTCVLTEGLRSLLNGRLLGGLGQCLGKYWVILHSRCSCFWATALEILHRNPRGKAEMGRPQCLRGWSSQRERWRWISIWIDSKGGMHGITSD